MAEPSLSELADLIRGCSASIQLFKEEFNERFISFEANINNKFAIADVKISELQTRNSMLEDKVSYLESQLKLTDLLVFGIPYMENEDLNIYNMVCGKIGFSSSEFSLQSIFRTRSKMDSSIVLKFISQAVRNTFFHLYLAQKDLSNHHWFSYIKFCKFDR